MPQAYPLLKYAISPSTKTPTIAVFELSTVAGDLLYAANREILEAVGTAFLEVAAPMPRADDHN